MCLNNVLNHSQASSNFCIILQHDDLGIKGREARILIDYTPTNNQKIFKCVPFYDDVWKQ